MSDIVVPTLGESISEATVGRWFKSVGDTVARDEVLVELETDKVSVEVPAGTAGVLNEIVAAEGATVEIGSTLGRLAATSAGASPQPEPTPPPPPDPIPAPSAAANRENDAVAPSVRRIAIESGLDVSEIAGTGPGGRVTKADALAAAGADTVSASPPPPAPAANQIVPARPARPEPAADVGVPQERVRMSRLRQTVSRRLKDAQNTAAILTTFNDVDVSEVMALRKRHGDGFKDRHGVKLGFMGFFVKACVAVLKEIPVVNAEIDGDEIVYHHRYDIAIAVGTDKGLVTPVVRDADRMSLAEIEGEIARLGGLARQGELTVADLRDGTFTITNGGVYGSMLSTPILNAPQSAILGMHRIEERPVARDGEVVIRPMMYLALSYDHRLIDGREAVGFLVRVKQCLEDPERMLLDL